MSKRSVNKPRTKCHQREIREKFANDDPRLIVQNLNECTVEAISTEDAKQVILKYEWLGTMGRNIQSYGLLDASGDLLGVASFGWPGGVQSRDICGKENRDLAICLERGACVHWAHPHAASYLISRACKMAARDRGWRIFYAYSDPAAGEIGTVYQACNWLYIGQGVGRTPGRMRQSYKSPEGEKKSSRWLQHKGYKKHELLAKGWTIEKTPPKHKYIRFEGSKTRRKKLRAKLRYPLLPYPKREIQH